MTAAVLTPATLGTLALIAGLILTGITAALIAGDRQQARAWDREHVGLEGEEL